MDLAELFDYTPNAAVVLRRRHAERRAATGRIIAVLGDFGIEFVLGYRANSVVSLEVSRIYPGIVIWKAQKLSTPQTERDLSMMTAIYDQRRTPAQQETLPLKVHFVFDPDTKGVALLFAVISERSLRRRGLWTATETWGSLYLMVLIYHFEVDWAVCLGECEQNEQGILVFLQFFCLSVAVPCMSLLLLKSKWIVD